MNTRNVNRIVKHSYTSLSLAALLAATVVAVGNSGGTATVPATAAVTAADPGVTVGQVIARQTNAASRAIREDMKRNLRAQLKPLLPDWDTQVAREGSSTPAGDVQDQMLAYCESIRSQTGATIRQLGKDMRQNLRAQLEPLMPPPGVVAPTAVASGASDNQSHPPRKQTARDLALR